MIICRNAHSPFLGVLFIIWCSHLFRNAFAHHFVNTFADIEETDEAYAVELTSDDGYIVAGCTESFENFGDWDGILIKYDKNGTVEWSTIFGGEGDDVIHGVITTEDDGFIIVGETTSYSDGNRVFDIILAKFMSNGTYEWTEIIGGGENEGGKGIYRTSDEGFIITGYTQTNAIGLEALLLAKYDSDFTVEWIRTLDGGVLDSGNDVVETYDGGFVVTGWTYSTGAGSSDLLLAKFESNGDIEWVYTFGGESDEVGMEVTELIDDEGSLVVVGHTISYSTGLKDMLIIKAYENGTSILVKTLGGEANDFAEGVDSTSDSGWVLTGANDEHDDDMVVVAKYAVDGTLEWAKYVGEEQDDVSYSVKQTRFGEYITCGETENYGSVDGNENIFVVLLEADGTGCSKDWDTDEQVLSGELIEWAGMESNDVTVNFTFALRGTTIDVDVYYLPDPGDYSLRFCPCDDDYYGSQCDVWSCWGVFINDTESTAICSDHGDCTSPDYCECTPAGYYFGGKCNTTQCGDIDSTDSENVCSGHGTCHLHDECSCDQDYYTAEGSDDDDLSGLCSLWYCHGSLMNSVGSCSGNGDCVSPDYCSCSEGYDGDTCHLYSCGFVYTDSDTCSGNGHCLGPDDCDCNPGFIGTHCEVNTLLYSVMTPILAVSFTGMCCFLVFCCICSVFVLSIFCVVTFISIDLTRRYLEKKPTAPLGERLTFVFTDIVASTELWNEYPEQMKRALEIHDRVLKKSLIKHGGFLVKMIGDSFFCTFKNPIQALHWACDIQEKLLEAKWPKKLLESEYAEAIYKYFGDEHDTNTKRKLLYRGLPLRVGINLGGHFQRKKNRKYKTYDYVGQTINKTSRIETACRAGYILLGEGYYQKIVDYIAKDQEETWKIWRLKKMKLRGFLGTHRLYSVLPIGLKERADDEIKKLVNHQYKVENVLEIDSGSDHEEDVEDIVTPSSSFKRSKDIFGVSDEEDDKDSSSGEDKKKEEEEDVVVEEETEGEETEKVEDVEKEELETEGEDVENEPVVKYITTPKVEKPWDEDNNSGDEV